MASQRNKSRAASCAGSVFLRNLRRGDCPPRSPIVRRALDTTAGRRKHDGQLARFARPRSDNSSCAIGFLALSAAEAQAPPKTGEFVKFCSNNSKTCFSKIQAVDIGNMAGALWAPNVKSKSVCPIPDGVKSDMARMLIVGWLGRHPETTNLDTDAGITLAIKQIWSCRPAIAGADAKTPSGGPSRTAEFLAYCKTRVNGCYNDILVET